MKKQDLCLVGKSSLITEDSPETILGGLSPVGPVTSMQGISGGTTLYGGEVGHRSSASIPITALGGQGAPPIHSMLPHPAPEGVEQVGPPSAPVGLGELLPLPAGAISCGHSSVGPATTTAVQEIPATSVQGVPGSTTLSAGGVAPNDPSSSVNANPDRAQQVIADPADGDTAAGRMLRNTRELIGTAILDPALSALAMFLHKALVAGNMERIYCIAFMAAILLLLRKHI